MNKKTIFYILMILVTVQIVNANLLSIDIDKEKYTVDEVVKGTITLKNNFNKELDIILEKYFYPKDRPLLDEEPFFNEIKLKPFETKIITDEFLITEDTIPGDYVFDVSIVYLGEVKSFDRIKLEKIFNVYGTKKILTANLIVCKTKECLIKNTVFLINEKAYTKIISDVKDLIITGKLELPNKNIINLDFKDDIAEVNINQLGTYELEVTASKEGYKTIAKKEQFGVIEKEANIPYTDLSKIEEKREFNKLYILTGLIVLLIFIVIYFRKKKK